MIPHARALLCADCDFITEMQDGRSHCGRCGSESVLVIQKVLDRPTDRIAKECQEAAGHAIVAMSRYKFIQFGYWAAIWVHFNRIANERGHNPFQPFVRLAREILGAKKTSEATRLDPPQS